MAKEENLLLGTQPAPPPTPEISGLPRITQIMIPKGTIHNNHIEQGSSIVKFGLAADRPTSGDVYPVYFAYDTYVLSCWTGSAWKSTTLS